MRLLFVGALWEGSTALQRLRAFETIGGLEVSSLDSLERVDPAPLVDRIRHRLRWPRDKSHLNQRLRSSAEGFRPDIVFVDSTRVLTRKTLTRVKEEYGAHVIFYSPDDVSAPHNSSRQLEACDDLWDIFFTTKTFNVPELRARGVRRPRLIGKAYDPVIHRPMEPAEVGSEFEHFDVVFAGTYEGARLQSLNHLAEAGISVVVHGGSWSGAKLHPDVTVRGPIYSTDYTRVLHTGKLALCFLRKMNRDKVTQRSVELPAACRPMLAEKTEEHDRMFADGVEYVSFASDAELVERTRALLVDGEMRASVARAGRQRCLASGYSTLDRAREMLHAIQAIG